MLMNLNICLIEELSLCSLQKSSSMR